MSSVMSEMDPDPQKTLEETLREAACYGDTDKVSSLLCQGVNPNSRNSVNGRTALFWAVERSHDNVVKELINNGADCSLTDYKGVCVTDLAIKPRIIQLLGKELGTDVMIPPNSQKDDDTTFTPNYLKYPPLAPKINGPVVKTPASSLLEPAAAMNKLIGPNVTQQSGGAAPNELVVKVRVANCPDPDFIEVEVPEPTYSSLLNICCEELGVQAQRVTKVRKLPNTIVRKDKDVQRFQYLQELELVLEPILEDGIIPIQNGELPMMKSNSPNSYQSISKYKNQTILY